MSLHKNSTGRSLHEPAQYKALNNTGATLLKGTVVKRTGYDGAIEVDVSTSPGSDLKLGIVLDDIADGTLGYVAAQGDFGEFDTSAFAVDDILYSDLAGNLTTVPFGNALATVLHVDATDGHLFTYVALPVSAPSGGSGGGHEVYTAVVTPTDISNGYMTLPSAPTEPASTIVQYEGAPGQIYGIDFSVVTNQLTFIGLPAESGETITILFK